MQKIWRCFIVLIVGFMIAAVTDAKGDTAVSYTHLDVYKRQGPGNAGGGCGTDGYLDNRTIEAGSPSVEKFMGMG